ncbi:E3 ubiquitin-protein ligase PPP1R11 [Aplysia californica]|uniref:E3 ubiquitin-protein ligase PPP1R11 n=1 Tax=Aplysia californica TaxID=6500 RepID=A0ABM0JJL0_APLCA|nr:E3 ubiquitin-protein ligase PPP1R11 [Aplysia californica]
MAEAQPGTSTQPVDSGTATETVVVDKSEEQESPPVLHLRLQKPKNDHKVKWSTDTVDNEFMGKKKSKCCCIYEKPKVFGESDSSSSSDDSDDEGCTPHCRGHKKKCYQHSPHPHNNGSSHDHAESGGQHRDDAGPSRACPYPASPRMACCPKDGLTCSLPEAQQLAQPSEEGGEGQDG